MPVNPAQWTADQAVSANKLNTDLYTFVPGNAFTPNGILFHARRPILSEFVVGAEASSVPYSPTSSFASWQSQGGPAFNAGVIGSDWQWCNWWDTAAAWGSGADFAYPSTRGIFSAFIPGQGGNFETTPNGGGYYMLLGACTVTSVPTAAASVGIGYCPSNSLSAPTNMLANQLGGSARDNTAYGIDLIQPINGNTAGTVLGTSVGTTTGTGNASSNPAFGATHGDPTGEGSFLQTWWAAVNNNNTVVSGGPTPPGTFTGASSITSAALNADVANVLTFLNSPPLLRAASVNTTTITQNTATAVSLTTTSGAGLEVDTYSGLSGSTYTVPVSGVYLVHGSVAYVSDASSSYNMLAGVQINGTTNYWGPGYQSSGGGASLGATLPAYTALLDLQAGDTVKLMTQHNKSATTTLNGTGKTPCRLILQWLGALGVPATSWQNPDTGFRWQAGDPNLVADFNAHLTNDLGFLINRPYLLTHQATAQTGKTITTNFTVTMDTVGGQVHGSNGDNYSGWSAGANNEYTCQRAGWYLVVGSYIFTAASGVTSGIWASVLAPGLGQTQSAGGLMNGQHVQTTSGAMSPGADFVRLVYLSGGDTITPTAQMQNSNATCATSVNQISQQVSTFGLIWMGQ